MKKSIIVLVAFVTLVVSGCVASSHATVGPATVQSSVAMHEYRVPAFYAEDGVVGSTLAFWSSQVGASLQDCNELSFGGTISWNQESVAAYPPAVAEQTAELVASAADEASLTDAGWELTDFSGKGNVVLLNNGIIIVEIPTRVFSGEDGNLTFTGGQRVAFQTKQAFESDNLQSIMSLEDVDFDLTFEIDEDGQVAGSVSVDHDGRFTQFQFTELATAQTSSYTATCGVGANENTCTQTCPSRKACIAYCSLGIANCNCVDIPPA